MKSHALAFKSRQTPAPARCIRPFRVGAAETVARQKTEIRQILHGPRLQAKLTVGAPDDEYEREADRVADEVMRMPESPAADRRAGALKGEDERVQRLCSECEQGQPIQEEEETLEEELVQPKPVGGQCPTVNTELESRIRSLEGRGQPLPDRTRSFYESRFGYDFRTVRIHTDEQAAATARALHACGFTLGSNIVFAEGQYAPDTPTGKKLLAHELTHVIQQKNYNSMPSMLSRSKSKEKREINAKECKGSRISIEVEKSADLSFSFSTDPLEAMLSSSPVLIFVPRATTKVQQDELLEGTLRWSCPDGRIGEDSETHTISWSTDEEGSPRIGGRLHISNGRKVAYDGHVYGFCCKPGSDLREAAESEGFEPTRCNWEYIQDFTATTAAIVGDKIRHRCEWKFHFIAQQKVDTDGTLVSREASVTYSGVDKVEEK